MEATLGSDNLQQLKTSISGPFNHWLRGRLSLVETHRDAWIDNTAGADSDTLDSRAIRAWAEPFGRVLQVSLVFSAKRVPRLLPPTERSFCYH